MKKIYLILLLLALTPNYFTQELEYEYIDSACGFRFLVPNGFSVKQLEGSNITNLYNENKSVFARIHLLHLKDFVEKKELANQNDYHNLTKRTVNDLMNSIEIRTPESELNNRLDSLIDAKTSNNVNYFIAYRKEIVSYNSGVTDIYYVQPYYFIELIKDNDVIILLFKNSDDEMNKREFTLNIKKQELVLKIIDSVTLYKD